MLVAIPVGHNGAIHLGVRWGGKGVFEVGRRGWGGEGEFVVVLRAGVQLL